MIEIRETSSWRNTIEELKGEQLAEGVRDFLKNFFSKPPPSKLPSPPGLPTTVTDPKEYIDQLNAIFDKHQAALDNFIVQIKFRGLRRKMEYGLNFRNIPSRNKRKKPLEIPAAVAAKTTPTFSSPKAPDMGVFPKPIKTSSTVPIKAKKKTDLPYNSIVETRSYEWRSRYQELEKILNDANRDVLDFLLRIASSSGYVPKNPNNLKMLVSEMRNFTFLDKKTLYILRIKLVGFMMTYRTLEDYLKFFKRIEDAQIAAEKEAQKKRIP